MLSRSVVPLLRPRAFPSAVRLSLVLQQSRSYARDKHRKPQDYKIPDTAPPSSRPPDAGQPAPHKGTPGIGVAAGAAFAAQKSRQSSEPEFSEEQEEFVSSVKSQSNTPPQSAEAGPGTTRARSAHGREDDIQEEIQREFDTNPDPEGNTSAESTTGGRPLPDLTQGIPSTLDAELAEAAAKHQAATNLNLTEAGEETSAGGRGRGGGPKSEYIPSSERTRNRVASVMLGVLSALILSGTIFLGRNWETEGEEEKHVDSPSGWGFGLFFGRAKARLADFTDYYNEPAFPKLLPKEDPQYAAPFTLVLSLEDLLVHSEWSREHGWRMAKRPGVDYFLRYLSQYYELVLFTSVPSMMADPVLRKLDPFRVIRWPLFREATRYKNGEYIKDLSYLNRDLSKIILIDTVPAHAQAQPENAIILPKWTGDPKDKVLVSFIPFLEYIATMGFDDARAVIKSFEGTYIPAEFAKREKIIREKFEKQLAEERKRRPKRSIGSLGSLFGIKSSTATTIDGEHTASEGLEQGKMLWDQIRERGQKQYEQLDKDIRENGEKWLGEMAAEEEKMRDEQMKGMRNSMAGWFGSGGGGGGGGSSTSSEEGK